MFTGIVEELGTVKAIAAGEKSIQITIAAMKVLGDLAVGDSIAVNGVCLTVVRFTARDFTADVMPETLRLTVLEKLKRGDAVNLERALTLNNRLGGHIVSGHVDGLGQITQVTRDDNAVVVRVDIAEYLAKYVVQKGSVTIDGISLTVVDCGRDWFRISMIPHTAAMTTLGFKRPGDFVNIENDLIGKYVERLLSFDERVKPAGETKLTRDFLNQCGF